MTTQIEINDVVKYSRPQNEEEGNFRFRVLEIHRNVENPRAHIQLICDWRIKPVEVLALTDIEPARQRRKELDGLGQRSTRRK
jgi:hypothetical protein